MVFLFGSTIVIVFLVFVIFIPNPSPFQYEFCRIILASALAGTAAYLPGFLDLQIGRKLSSGLAPVIRAGGALAVFVIAYFFSPASLVVPSPMPPEEVPESVVTVGSAGNSLAEETGNICQGAKEYLDALGVELRGSLFDKLGELGIKEGTRVMIINQLNPTKRFERPIYRMLAKEQFPHRIERCVIAMGISNRIDLGLPPDLGGKDSPSRKGKKIKVLLPTA